MTVLDDDRLSALLAHAGAAFEVPATGTADILEQAAGGPSPRAADEDARPTGAVRTEVPDDLGPVRRARARRLAGVAGRHRLLTAAACVGAVLIVAGTIGALVHGPTGPATTSSLGHAPARSGPASNTGLSTTTVPRSPTAGGTHAGGTTQQKGAALPFSANAAPGTNGTPASPTVTTPTTPSLPSGAVGQSARIEQTGSLGLTVGRGDLNATMTRLTALAAAFGGFVANSQTQTGAGSGGPPSGSITLQVPVDDFAAALKQAQALGKTTELSTKATDVTGQYVDLQARIAALEASRQQYLTILTKATTVGDVLAVQEQIDGIQSQIEQLQGQLQVLTSETSYSTLTVTVSEGTPPPRPGPLPESGLVRAWHDSVGGFVDGVEGVIRLAGPVLFALLCLAVLLVGGRGLWRRYQRHRL